jgi:hypothetical protein
VLWPTAAILVSAGFLVVWLQLDVRGFRTVLARRWHGQHFIRRTRDHLNTVKAALTIGFIDKWSVETHSQTECGKNVKQQKKRFERKDGNNYPAVRPPTIADFLVSA